MKILATILYTFLIIFLVIVAGVFLASMAPIPGHVSLKIVKSGSMEPALHVGSIVVIQPQKSYAVGEVITFGPDNKTQIPTTHRIVEIGADNGSTVFTTKGDANEDPDPNRAKLAEVEGKVIATVPYAGYVLDFAKKPIGFVMMIAIPATIIILDEILRILNEIGIMRRKKRSDQSEKSDEEEYASGLRRLQETQDDRPNLSVSSGNIDGVRSRTRLL